MAKGKSKKNKKKEQVITKQDVQLKLDEVNSQIQEKVNYLQRLDEVRGRTDAEIKILLGKQQVLGDQLRDHFPDVPEITEEDVEEEDQKLEESA